MSFEKIDNDELREAVRRFTVFLRADYERFDKDGETYCHRAADQWVPDAPGKNVVRINHVAPGHKSSYCFIVLRDFERGGKTWLKGDILMAAGYKAPAFNKARGNVMTNSYGKATWAGPGYLT